MSLGRRQLSLGRRDGTRGQVIFDTGSSYTYFPEEAYDDLVASVSSLILILMENMRTNSFFTSSFTDLTDYLMTIMQLKDVSNEGLILDESDLTLPICWKAKFPLRYEGSLVIEVWTKWMVVISIFEFIPAKLIRGF